MPWTQYSMCVEVWPHPYMKNTFTLLILCTQYLLPLIVLPVVHALVFTYNNLLLFYQRLSFKILRFLEQNSGMAQDSRRKEKEQKRNKRMTFVLSCIAVTFAVSLDFSSLL